MKKWFYFISLIVLLASILIPLQVSAGDNEVLSARTENSKTFRLSKNRYAINASINPIHYRENPKDTTSQWLDIDTTIIDGQVNKAPYNLTVNLTGEPSFRYTSKYSGDYFVSLALAYNDIESIAPNKVEAVVTNNKVIWPNYYPNVDVYLTANNDGVILGRVIKSDKAPLNYFVNIQTIDTGQATIRSLENAVDSIGQPIKMIEDKTVNGRYEKLELEVVNNPTAKIVYPIYDATIIDEQVNTSTNDGHIYYYDNYSGATYSVTGTALQIGSLHNEAPSHDWFYHSWAKWDGITIPIGSEILTAYVSFVEYNSGSGNTTTLIYFNDTESPTYPTDFADYLSKTLTTANVTNTHLCGTNGWYDTDSIVPVIQELVNSYDFDNDSMMILWKPDDTLDVAKIYSLSYDQNPSNAWSIYIEFNPAIPPDAPRNLTLTQVNVSTVNATWTKADSANTTLVISTLSYPSSPTSNYFICETSDNTCLIENLSLDLNTYYVSAWSNNQYGYSVNFAIANIGGSNMIQIGAIIIGIALFFTAFFVKRGLIWAIPLGYHAIAFYVAVIDGWSVYYFIPLGGFTIICLIVFVVKMFKGDFI